MPRLLPSFLIVVSGVWFCTFGEGSSAGSPSPPGEELAGKEPEWPPDLKFGLVASLGGVGLPKAQLPMYGGIAKSPELLESDRAFIELVLAEGVTREEGSDIYVKIGTNHFHKGNMARAMMRFNQAWLLDPDNGDAYHGFAIVVYHRDRYWGGAQIMFERAIKAPRQSPAVFGDYGRMYLIENAPEDAIPLLKRAIELEPRNLDARINLMWARLETGDVKAACNDAVELLAIEQFTPSARRSEVAKLIARPDCK